MQRPSDSGDLESILYELERKQVDCCIYYVALDSLGINATSEDTNDEGWSLPTESKPGEWRVVENPEINLLSDYGVSRPRLLKLHTLSGLILFSRLKRKLFLAEFAGSSIEIQSNVIPISGDKSVPFSRNVRKGVMVAKARLIREESNWNDYTAYRFACDCAERAISRNTLVHNHVDSIYLEGIKFVRASAKFLHLDDHTEIDRFLGKSFSQREERMESWLAKKSSLEKEIEEAASLDYAGKALLDCLIKIYTPFRAANMSSRNARVNHAMMSFLELKAKGHEVPSWSLPKEHERDTVDRIWFLHQIRELDWQVAHLENILRNGI